jgi:hypothetical protein
MVAQRDESDRSNNDDSRDSNRGRNRSYNRGRNRGDNNGNNNGRNNDDNNDPTLIMTDTHKVYLEFYIELLQQRITRKKYDSALICALAVLGVKNNG